MAGSIKTFVYQASAPGVPNCVFNADESNGEAVANIDLTDPTRGTSLPGIPSGLRPRYAVYKSAEGHTRKVIISTAAAMAALPVTISAADPMPGGAAIVLPLAQTVAEHVKAYSGADTGLTDGDLT